MSQTVTRWVLEFDFYFNVLTKRKHQQKQTKKAQLEVISFVKRPFRMSRMNIEAQLLSQRE